VGSLAYGWTLFASLTPTYTPGIGVDRKMSLMNIFPGHFPLK
jgi:hypothetical protein